MFISVGYFGGLTVTGSIFQLFQKPGAVQLALACERHVHTHMNTWGRVVEHKMEPTYEKLEAVYYGIAAAILTNIILLVTVHTKWWYKSAKIIVTFC